MLNENRNEVFAFSARVRRKAVNIIKISVAFCSIFVLGTPVLILCLINYGTYAIGLKTEKEMLQQNNRWMCWDAKKLFVPFVLWLSGVKYETVYQANIKWDRPMVFIINHMSTFDILLVISALMGNFRFIVKKEIFKAPIIGIVLWLSDHVYVKRQDHARAVNAMQEASRDTQYAHILCFAEGTRSKDGKLQKLKKGGFIYAIQNKMPIVPVSVSGTHKALPKAKLLRLNPKHPCKIVIGAPIDTHKMHIDDRDKLIEKVRRVIKNNIDDPIQEQD